MGKFGTKLTNSISIEPSDSAYSNQVNLDLKQLANSCFVKNSSQLLTNIVEHTYDLCLNLENNFQIKVHKAFVIERSDYFKTYLNDPFNEMKQSDQNKLSVEQLNLKEIDLDIVKEIIYFIYSDCFSCDNLDENVLLDVLIAADLYLIPSLKRKCANELIKHINNENLFELLKLSRLYDLKKLEFSCISHLAINIFDVNIIISLLLVLLFQINFRLKKQFESSQELRQLILEDASKLKQRQETDTIDIIDDLRYAINDTVTLNNTNMDLNVKISATSTATNFISSYDLLIEKERKLNLVDKILNELNLEC